MKNPGSALAWLLLLSPAAALALGVTPYLPLNLEPEIESQIERVLILGGKPVMTRPIPAAAVIDALPQACRVDRVLCERVEKYLSRYTHSAGITHASIGGAAASGRGDTTVDPNHYGMPIDSHWEASAQVYWQPSDYLLIDAGALGYQGRTNFQGSMVSLGFDWAQLDFGFRAHWFSPMTDSSFIMSTEAPTRPSVTLSNYEPVTPLNLHYELFAETMTRSERILDGTGFTAGDPRLAGLHLDIQPASGWALGANRLIQFGGGALGGGSIHDLLDAFFNPSASQTRTDTHQPFGKQEASFTSNLIVPAKIPFSVYFEYAGNDISRGKNYLLGNSALSAGIHFPRLFENFDLTFEISEWQNTWYTSNIYQNGQTNYGLVIGNWVGDQRLFNDAVGGNSHMVNLGYTPQFGGLFELKYRSLQNQLYGDYPYKHFQQVSLGYSRPWLGVIVGGEVDEGRDVFGANFTRLEGFVRYDEAGGHTAANVVDAMTDDSTPLVKDVEIFVDAGANVSRENIDLQISTDRHNSPVDEGYHFALGARRAVSEHNDLGARLEVDNVQGHSLIGARIVDYRYRFNNPLSLGLFLGADRYDLATPAYGIYYGLGVQWRNILPGWDLGADYRYANSVARDHLVPSDPPSIDGRPDSFYDISSVTLYISRHF